MRGAVPCSLLLHFGRQLLLGPGIIIPHGLRVAYLGLIVRRGSYLRGRVPGVIVGVVNTQWFSSAPAAPNGGGNWSETVFEDI
ncbi:hypothetical protein EDB86DRAFT_2964287 [Lactarius hatsudake]|nr:hypothetical protein EDB86DRAFT_2964287 [Lactarius hatsudake]